MKNLLFILCVTLLMSCDEVKTYKSEHVLLDTDSLMAHVDGKLEEKIHEKDSIIHVLEIHDSLDLVHIKELEDAEQKRVRAIRELQDAQMSQVSAKVVEKERKDSIVYIRDTTYLAAEPVEPVEVTKIVRDTVYSKRRKKKRRKKN